MGRRIIKRHKVQSFKLVHDTYSTVQTRGKHFSKQVNIYEFSVGEYPLKGRQCLLQGYI